MSNFLVLMERSHLVTNSVPELSLNGLLIFFLQFLPQVILVSYHTNTELNFILGREETAQTKGTEFRLGKGISDVKRQQSSKVENTSSMMYYAKKVGVDLGFICRDNTLLSNDNKTLRQM